MKKSLTLCAISLVFHLSLWESKRSAETHLQTGHSHGEGPLEGYVSCYSACRMQ